MYPHIVSVIMLLAIGATMGVKEKKDKGKPYVSRSVRHQDRVRSIVHIPAMSRSFRGMGET